MVRIAQLTENALALGNYLMETDYDRYKAYKSAVEGLGDGTADIYAVCEEITRKGYLPERECLRLISNITGFPAAEYERIALSQYDTTLFPARLMRKYLFIPLESEDSTTAHTPVDKGFPNELTLICARPDDEVMQKGLRSMTDQPISLYCAPKRYIESTLMMLLGAEGIE